MMRPLISFVFALLWLLLAAFIALFAASNPTPIILKLWPLEQQVQLAPWVLLMVGMGFGLLLAGAVTSWYRLKAFVRTRKTDRQNKRLAAANQSLTDEAGALRTSVKQQQLANHQQMLEKSS